MDKKTARKFMGKIEDIASGLAKYVSNDSGEWNDMVANRALKSLQAACDHLEDIEESYRPRGRMLKEDKGKQTKTFGEWAGEVGIEPEDLYADGELLLYDTLEYVSALMSWCLDDGDDTDVASVLPLVDLTIDRDVVEWMWNLPVSMEGGLSNDEIEDKLYRFVSSIGAERNGGMFKGLPESLVSKHERLVKDALDRA